MVQDNKGSVYLLDWNCIKLSLLICLLVLSMGCVGQSEPPEEVPETSEPPGDVSEPGTVSLQVGEYYKYRFVINDIEFGYADYRIKAEEDYEGHNAYCVELSLSQDLNKLGAQGKVELQGTLYIKKNVLPLFYQAEALVNGGKQTIECTFSENKAHDVVTVGEEKYEEEFSLEENTYLMDNNMIGLWALVYRTLSLEVGQTYEVPLFFSANLSKYTVEIEVLRTETIVVAGKSYEVFVCNVPLFNEIDYVTKDGLLVRIELPSQNGFIELV